jgi:hypothetical protein
LILNSQAAPNSDSVQNSTSKSDGKKNMAQHTSKPNIEGITQARTSTLSSLSNLPPLSGVTPPVKQPTGSVPGSSQSKDIHKIKSMIDLGLGMYAHMNFVYGLSNFKTTHLMAFIF